MTCIGKRLAVEAYKKGYIQKQAEENMVEGDPPERGEGAN